jgi:hypothetical protein
MKYEFICKYCGNKYFVQKCQINRTKYCSKLCHNRAIIRRGEDSHLWRGGKTLKYRCIDCDKKVDHHATRCRKCRGLYVGRFHKSTLTAQIRGMPMTRLWMRMVKERDRICVACGSSENLQIDHIIPLKEIKEVNNIKSIEDARKCEQLWDIRNGRVLCHSCHLKTETFSNRKPKITIEQKLNSFN